MISKRLDLCNSIIRGDTSPRISALTTSSDGNIDYPFVEIHPLTMKATHLVIGCGDIGRRVARLERQAGGSIEALVRSTERCKLLLDEGIHPLVGDLDRPDSLSAILRPADIVYYFAPPPPSGLDDPRLRHWLEAMEAPPRRLIYISTSGVYGDCQGGWIDETAPLTPLSQRGQRRLAAESMLASWSQRNDAEIIILRVPGIYGPGRLPLERLRKGLPVIAPEEAPYTNRIHADDLAKACLAAARLGRPGSAYNISDGHPSTMTDYFWRVADLFDIPRPKAISLEQARSVLSQNMLSFLDESKRLDNQKMRRELLVTLAYPTLEEGLLACRYDH